LKASFAKCARKVWHRVPSVSWYPPVDGTQIGVEDAAIRGRRRPAVNARRDEGSMTNSIVKRNSREEDSASGN